MYVCNTGSIPKKSLTMAVDLRSSITMDRKRSKLSTYRVIVCTNVWNGHEATIIAHRFQREEEKTDEKASKGEAAFGKDAP